VKLCANPDAAGDGGDWWKTLTGDEKASVVTGLLNSDDLWLAATATASPRQPSPRRPDSGFPVSSAGGITEITSWWIASA